MILCVTDVAFVGVLFLLAMTFLVIRLFRAIERTDEVDPNQPRSFVDRLFEAGAADLTRTSAVQEGVAA